MSANPHQAEFIYKGVRVFQNSYGLWDVSRVSRRGPRVGHWYAGFETSDIARRFVDMRIDHQEGPRMTRREEMDFLGVESYQVA